MGVTVLGIQHVALRKESVDRNYMGVTVLGIQHRSLSARRAWIEIVTSVVGVLATLVVALRKESVDRNGQFGHAGTHSSCRSPQGERG